MSIKRSKKVQKRRGRHRIGAPAAGPGSSLSSLPPAAPALGNTLASSEDGVNTLPRSYDGASWRLPPDSKVRKTALKILAMRASFSDREIGEMLGIKEASVSAYVYRAGANGWIKAAFNSGKEAIENTIVPKIIKNLGEALDSETILQTGMKEKTAVALKAAEGTIFKQFDQQNGPAQSMPQMALQINIQQPPGTALAMREGTVDGVPAYIEADSGAQDR